MPHILIVEDEAAIADTLIFALQGEGFTTTWLSLGAAALEHQRATPADLIILDIGLPDISGFETCKQLRRFSDVPVMFLSARDAEIDRVVGLEIGADDYVVKPFSPREVAARVRAILKRMAPRPVAEVSEVASALFRIDGDRVQISYRNQPLSLTRHEFRLLQCLLEQPERVFSREQLLDALGVAADAGYERSIDSHIKSVRAKLRLVKADAEPIQTHRGLGYSYSPGHS
ncbi:two-component system catabolic regulation response regulator CreB [Pseudomonas sp. PvR086]|jgi:two-component system catabolic regulation response regulator CreB|uniref:two-component system response regulator CreB n=1 Tax=Pseudomonas TaxID=286 RepID=UPI000B356A20|nr:MULTISPECIES: two-component system response regulator CreB [Pseudomonas]MBD9605739.1 two-component system response regulator CreB [Pseudomonas sp. PDM08]MDR7106986.1 two-component system catabolic regulation response regulator CreB [Pseudomonas frederiksbergensis]PMY53937.1 two-component system response regulator CreB [Pseudomonas sp. FW305-53]PMY86650.1 two-component system response regulator CreB [Pseudomonas sp. FW303-C2]PMY94587.1 two-component system response regulator CreB [Pseudomona